jgi:hypothetical protein
LPFFIRGELGNFPALVPPSLRTIDVRYDPSQCWLPRRGCGPVGGTHGSGGPQSRMTLRLPRSHHLALIAQTKSASSRPPPWRRLPAACARASGNTLHSRVRNVVSAAPATIGAIGSNPGSTESSADCGTRRQGKTDGSEKKNAPS